jgi:hypothetical protein
MPTHSPCAIWVTLLSDRGQIDQRTAVSFPDAAPSSTTVLSYGVLRNLLRRRFPEYQVESINLLALPQQGCTCCAVLRRRAPWPPRGSL